MIRQFAKWHKPLASCRFACSSRTPFQVMLASSFDPNKHQVDGWLASEKYDGVRTVFIPQEGLFTRRGTAIPAPDWFVDGLGNCMLDGELWIDRGNFPKIASIVATTKNVDERLIYLCFPVLN